MIVHVMGLPGAGKSTLTKRLSAWLGWPVLSIGAFRKGRSPDHLGEVEAWRAFYEALDEHGWTEVIVETSGLNGRIGRLNEEVPADQMVGVKLVCDRDVLHERVGVRDWGRAPEPWAYSAVIPDRHVFIDRFYGPIAEVDADLVVDTGTCGPQETFERVRGEIADA